MCKVQYTLCSCDIEGIMLVSNRGKETWGSHHSINALNCTACTALHYTTMYCTVLHCTLLDWMHCTALHCTALLHCIALHYTALHCTELNWFVLHWIALRCTVLHRTKLHCTKPHYTELHGTLLNCTVVKWCADCTAPSVRASLTVTREGGDVLLTLLYFTTLHSVFHSTLLYNTAHCI